MFQNNQKPISEPAIEQEESASDDNIKAVLDALSSRQYEAAKAMEGKSAELLEPFAVSLQGQSENSVKLLGNVKSRLSEILTLSAWTNGNAQRLSHESTTVSGAIDEIASTMRSVSESSVTASQQTAEVKSLADSSVNRAQAAERAMSDISGSFDQLNDRLQSLDGAIEAIGGFAKDIEAISNQTKLLALNATIEAARAGEAGKGFAVVASEVKSLSEQTSRTTELIGKQLSELDSVMTAMIDSMTEGGSKVREGAESFDQVAEEVSKMRECIDTADAEMTSMNEALVTQTTTIEEVAKSVGEIAGLAKNNSDDSKTSIELLDSTENAVTHELDSYAQAQITNHAVWRLMGTHMEWKRRLADCLVGLADPAKLDATKVSRPLGEWLAKVDDSSIRQSAPFAALSEMESSLKADGESIAQLMAGGDFGGAIGAFFGMDEKSKEAIGHIEAIEAMSGR